MIVENIISWFLFALASTCTLSFASTIYDNFISSKRRERNKKASPGIVPLPDLKPSQLVTENSGSVAMTVPNFSGRTYGLEG